MHEIYNFAQKTINFEEKFIVFHCLAHVMSYSPCLNNPFETHKSQNSYDSGYVWCGVFLTIQKLRFLIYLTKGYTHTEAAIRPKSWISSVGLLLGILIFFNMVPAYAQAGNVSTITNALQGLIDIMTGKTATLLGIIAIAGIGFLWMAGKMSVQKAAIICMGIGVVFGAPKIISLLGAA